MNDVEYLKRDKDSFAFIRLPHVYIDCMNKYQRVCVNNLGKTLPMQQEWHDLNLIQCSDISDKKRG